MAPNAMVERFVVGSGDADTFDVIAPSRGLPPCGKLGFGCVSGRGTAPEQADFEDWLAAADPIRVAVGNLLVAIIENTAEGSRERQAAMTEALGAHERIRHVLAPKPTLM